MIHTPARILSNATAMVMATTAQKALSFLYFAWIARTRGVEETGLYFYALQLAFAFSFLFDLGISPLIVRESAKSEAGTRALLRVAFALKIMIAILVLIVAGVYAAAVYDWRFALMVWIAFLAAMLDAQQLSLYAYLRGQQRLAYEALAMACGQVITIVLGGAVLLSNGPLPMLVGALALTSMLHGVYSAALIRYFNGWWVKPRWDWSVMKEILQESTPFLLAAAGVKFLSSIDTIVLGALWPATVVGLYSVAYKLTFSFQFLPLSLISSLYPAMSWYHGEDQKKLRKAVLGGLRVLWIIGMPLSLGIATIALKIVTTVYGAAYAPSASILSVLALTIIVLFAQYPFGAYLNSTGEQRVYAKLIGVTAAVNVLLALSLVPSYGMMGAAVSSLMSHALLFVLGVVVVRRRLSLSLLDLLDPALRTFAPALAMALLTAAFVEVMPLPVVILLAVLCYGALAMLSGALSREELREVVRLIRGRHL